MNNNDFLLHKLRKYQIKLQNSPSNIIYQQKHYYYQSIIGGGLFGKKTATVPTPAPTPAPSPTPAPAPAPAPAPIPVIVIPNSVVKRNPNFYEIVEDYDKKYILNTYYRVVSDDLEKPTNQKIYFYKFDDVEFYIILDIKDGNLIRLIIINMDIKKKVTIDKDTYKPTEYKSSPYMIISNTLSHPLRGIDGEIIYLIYGITIKENENIYIQFDKLEKNKEKFYDPYKEKFADPYKEKPVFGINQKKQLTYIKQEKPLSELFYILHILK
jgi:hypothetical protein